MNSTAYYTLTSVKHLICTYQVIHLLFEHFVEHGRTRVPGVHHGKVEEDWMDFRTVEHLPEDLCCSAVQGNNIERVIPCPSEAV